MTALPCCHTVGCDKARAAHGGPRLRRHWFRLAEWTFPSAILLLPPKCPLCIAAYVAVVTGIEISATTAAFLKEVLVIVCATSLGYLVLRSCHIRGRKVKMVPGEEMDQWLSDRLRMPRNKP